MLGQNSVHLINYFQAVPGVAPIRDGINPATWMLEQSTISMESKLGVDFAQLYTSSELCKQAEQLVSQLSVSPAGDQELAFHNRYALGYGGQFMALLWKNHKQYWRNPDCEWLDAVGCGLCGHALVIDCWLPLSPGFKVVICLLLRCACTSMHACACL